MTDPAQPDDLLLRLRRGGRGVIGSYYEIRQQVADRLEALKAALWVQWEYNHSEHCTNEWPHTGDCCWPLPKVLGGDPGVYRTYDD